MTRHVALLVAAVFFALCAFADEPKKDAYTFYVDGQAVSPPVLSLNGTPETIRPGDVVEVGMLVTLGEPGVYRFEWSKGRLLLAKDNGGKKTAGVRISRDYESSDRDACLNPLDDMTKEEIAQLRGLDIECWPEGIADKLKHVDTERACVTLSDRVLQGDKNEIPDLPAFLEYLSIDTSISKLGCSSLSKYTSLKFLRIQSYAAFEPGCLKDNKALRYLGLRLARGFEKVSFIKNMHDLKTLDISHTQVKDLSDLAGLKSITVVKADMTPLKILPKKEIASLRRLNILSTKLSKDAVAAFVKANPKCKVVNSWTDMLHEALKAATRIRVRSGGTCHRNRAREKTLFEVKEAKKVKEVVGNIRIDDSESGFHCMCCGEPTFEFYEENKLIASFGFHHGRSVRWDSGKWPGDGLLTDESADYICKWLADNGLKHPLEARERGKKAERAARIRKKKSLALLPEEVVDKLADARTNEEALKAFESSFKDKAKLAELYLKLFGCDDCRWNLYAFLDSFLGETAMGRIEKPAMSKALKNVANDPQGANGAARWMFQERKWGNIDKSILKEVLPAVAQRALAHPRKFNRMETISALGEIGGELAKALLRKVLNSQIKPRTLKKGEEGEPDGMMQISSGYVDKYSEAAFAASKLAELGDSGSLPAIRKLREKAKGGDKKILDEAVKKLKAPEGK